MSAGRTRVLASARGYVHTLRWLGTCSVHRPPGTPEVVLSVEAETSRTPPELHETWLAQPRVWVGGPLAGGRPLLPSGLRPYSYTVTSFSTKPAREPVRWSDEAKHRVRRLRLWRRLTQRAPLVAAEEYARAVSAKPQVYGWTVPGPPGNGPDAPPLPPDDAGPVSRKRAYESSRVVKARMKAERRRAQEAALRAAGWQVQRLGVPDAPWEPGTLFHEAD